MLELREYQRESIDAIHKGVEAGKQRMMVALPTGTGKTVCFAHLLKERRGRALVIAHRDELLQQAKDKIMTVWPEADVGICEGSFDEVHAHVVLASIQTVFRDRRLTRLLETTNTDLFGEAERPFETVIVDEAHHAHAASYVKVLKALGSFDEGGPLTIGYSATPERGDGRKVAEIWEEVSYRKDILWMIQQDYLSDITGIQVKLDADFNQLRKVRGDFVDSEVSAMMEEADAPAVAARAFLEHARDRKAIIFTPTVDMAYRMKLAFREFGFKAEALDQTTTWDDRKRILREFKEGKVKIVANCAILTEGFDEPTVDCVMIARPTASHVLFVQMIGRGTRKSPGKENLLVIDLVGATERHDLITLSSMFGVEPARIAKKRSVTAALKELQEEQLAALKRQAVQDARVAAEIRVMTEAVNLFKAKSGFVWIAAGTADLGNAFRLSLGSGRDLEIFREGDATWSIYELTRTATGYGAPSTSRKKLRAGLDQGFAQGVAEDLVKAAGAAVLNDKNARWRKDEPTDKQVMLLKKWNLWTADMTKGKASEIISARFSRR